MSSILNRKIAIGTTIVNAQYNLDIGEKYILYLALAGVNQKSSTNLSEGCKINVKDFALIRGDKSSGELIPQRLDNAKEELSRCIKSLINRKIKLYNNEGILEEYVWITAYRAIDIRGDIYLLWNPALVPHLSELKTYANMLTSIVAGLKGKYTNRILELCSQERSRGRTSGNVYIDLESFLNMIQASDTYRDFKYLKQYVLKPSIEELSNKNIVNIELETSRVNRKIIGFTLNYEFF